MKHLTTCILACAALWSRAQNNNGMIDQLEELGIRQTVWVPVAGGARLATDVYLPITGDSMALNFNVLGQNVYAQIIPKGIQLVVYPTMIDALGNEVPNPNPYRLPMLLARTPYGKDGTLGVGNAIPLFGYAFVHQDLRGRFHSEGTYLPMYSDGWKKTPYMNESALIDITPPTDPSNGLHHEDGWDTYQYLLHQYLRDYDLNGDGQPDVQAPVCNGTLGLVGASAFAIPHFQLAAAHRIDTTLPGLRSMVSLIATGEHYRHTVYHNGIFREQLVREWLNGQFDDLDESAAGTDTDLQNDLHTPADYGLLTNQAVIETTMDYLTEYRYPSASVANYYPNGPARPIVDISRAPVDAGGEGQAAGQFSRYGNMLTPNYNVTGWWDIFTSGQLETWRNMRQNLPPELRRLQKMVIGPWAHVTLSMQTTGDQTYPGNVADVLGLAADGLDLSNLANIDLAALFNSELIRWFRYTLNRRGYVQLGEPRIRIPRSNTWQDVGPFDIRIPSSNYDLTLVQFFNFLTGNGGLPGIPVAVDLGFGPPLYVAIDIPNIGAVLPIGNGAPIQDLADTDFAHTVPDLRLYVVGPTDSLNAGVGNYWLAAEDFPLPASEITEKAFFLHANGMLDMQAPQQDEGSRSYTHDPDQPVLTVGGGNLFNETPDGRDSHGQMNLADSSLAPLTMNRPDVLQFLSAPLDDTLCFIGIPKATIYVSSQPQGAGQGETDTDFMIRLVDVCPDGRELYITEGVVNARAREYVRSLYNGQEDPQAPFDNLQIGQVYELQFPFQAIAYTLGRQHRLKVLVSSSNYPRYQSNPNLPLEPGDFFRRQPGDGQGYTFQGQTLMPRPADNSLYFAPDRPSRLELPLYHYIETGTVQTPSPNPIPALQVYPNPTADYCRLNLPEGAAAEWTLCDAGGRTLLQGRGTLLDLRALPAGTYWLHTDKQTARVVKRGE